MSKRISEIQGIVSRALNELPEVFSTVQWGGRAYKVGNSKKFKLLAHVWINKRGDALHVDFKLEKKRAVAVVAKFAWIDRHSFRTLGSSGWITCELRTMTQAKAVVPLLQESRAMHPLNEEKGMRRRQRDSEVEIVVRTMDAVLSRKKAEGWRPIHDDDGFDD